MCRGKLQFKVQDGLRESLAQALASLMSRGGGNPGQSGSGSAPGGGAGDANDGYSVSAHTRMNTPVLGPNRSQFLPGGQGKGSYGQGGRGGSTAPREQTEDAGELTGRQTSGQGRSPELAPEKYRKALKRYFNQPEVKP